MKIGEPIEEHKFRRGSKFLPVSEKLANLPMGMSLPVTLESASECSSFIQFIYSHNRDGNRYRCNRRGLTVFVTCVQLASQRVSEAV